MQEFTSVNNPEIARILQAGGIGVLRTDTLYGLVASADNETAVQRIYELKHRDDAKSPIILVGSTDQLYDAIPPAAISLINEVWPGKVSIILPSQNAPLWIRRDNNSVAYRLPADDSLRKLLNETGRLIAPSANPEGSPPAIDIAEAKAYFGGAVDFYVDGGRVLQPEPSQLLRVNHDGVVERLR